MRDLKRDAAARARGFVEIDVDECKGCGLCVEACPPRVLQLGRELNRYGYLSAAYAGGGCSGCGICFYVCPEPGAITVYSEMRDLAGDSGRSAPSRRDLALVGG